MRATPPILAAFVVLVFSLSVIWSTTPSLALTQLTFILFSLLVTIIISQTSSSTLRSLALPAYIIAILSLIFTYILGQVTRGSVRWIEIGPFHLQTSETAKSLIILSFAYFLTQPILRPWRWLFTRILLLLPIALLVLLQPDLGSTIIISFIWFGMMLVSSLPRRYLLALTFTGLIALPLGYQLLEPYQQRRLTSFVNHMRTPLVVVTTSFSLRSPLAPVALSAKESARELNHTYVSYPNVTPTLPLLLLPKNLD